VSTTETETETETVRPGVDVGFIPPPIVSLSWVVGWKSSRWEPSQLQALRQEVPGSPF
jgi:hypothetical protein